MLAPTRAPTLAAAPVLTPQGFLDAMAERSRGLYPATRQGVLALELEGGAAAPASATALVTDHRPLGARQHRVTLVREKPTTLTLAEGAYTVAVAAPGHAPFRGFVDVRHAKPAAVHARLAKHTNVAPSFADRLKRFHLAHADLTIQDLTVAREQHVRLDARADTMKADLHRVILRTPAEAKATLGSDDTYWATKHPRFGAVFGRTPDPFVAGQLTIDQRAVLREFIYGNSQSVSREWQALLSEVLATDPFEIGVFVYNVVTVNAGATLEVGAGGLCCDLLRVHTTGTVDVSGGGPTVIQTGTYEAFS